MSRKRTPTNLANTEWHKIATHLWSRFDGGYQIVIIDHSDDYSQNLIWYVEKDYAKIAMGGSLLSLQDAKNQAEFACWQLQYGDRFMAMARASRLASPEVEAAPVLHRLQWWLVERKISPMGLLVGAAVEQYRNCLAHQIGRFQAMFDGPTDRSQSGSWQQFIATIETADLPEGWESQLGQLYTEGYTYQQGLQV